MMSFERSFTNRRQIERMFCIGRAEKCIQFALVHVYGLWGLHIATHPADSRRDNYFSNKLQKNKPDMKTPTEKAMDSLKGSMVQMRHDAVEEIKDGLRACIYDCVDLIYEKYEIIDRQTRKPVELKGHDLMKEISDSEWYQHEMIELLKRNEDDAFELMTWIVEPEDAPAGCASTDRFTANLPESTIATTRPPVARDQYILGVEQLGRSSLAQNEILHEASEYLQTIPDVVDQETSVQEAQDI